MARTPGSQRWLRITKELTWATFDGTGSTPTPTTSTVLWIELTGPDSYVLDADPKRWTIRTADGGNLRTQRGSHRKGFTGSLNTLLYPSQAAQLLGWFMTPTGSGASKALPSFTCDFWNGRRAIRTLGVRVSKGTIKSTDSDTDPNVMLSLELLGKSQVDDGTITLAEPAISVFPLATEIPFNHTHMSGHLTIAGSGRTGIKSATVEVNNVLYAPFFESTTIDRASYNGRDVGATLELVDPTETDRTNFESQVKSALAIGWTISSPAKAIAIDMQGSCYPGSYKANASFSEDDAATFGFEAFRDNTSGTDMAVTVT